MTREQLEQSIQTQLPTNGVGLIAAVNTRQVATDIADYIDDEIDEMNSKVPIGISIFSDYAVFNNQNGDYLFYMYPAEVNPARAGLMTSTDKQYLNSLTSTIIPGINEHINGILSTVTNLQNTKQNKLTVNNPIYLTNDILSLRDSSGNQINSIISTASEWVNVQNKTLASVELLKQMLYTKSDVNSILDAYYNKSEIDNTLANYYTKGETSILLNDYYTKSYVDTNYYNKNQTNTLLNNFYSKDYIDNFEESISDNIDTITYKLDEIVEGGNTYGTRDFILTGIYKTTEPVIETPVNNRYRSTSIINVTPGDVIQWTGFGTVVNSDYVLCAYDDNDNPVTVTDNNRLNYGSIRENKYTIPNNVYKIGFTWCVEQAALTDSCIIQIGEVQGVKLKDSVIEDIGERLNIDDLSNTVDDLIISQPAINLIPSNFTTTGIWKTSVAEIDSSYNKYRAVAIIDVIEGQIITWHKWQHGGSIMRSVPGIFCYDNDGLPYNGSTARINYNQLTTYDLNTGEYTFKIPSNCSYIGLSYNFTAYPVQDGAEIIVREKSISLTDLSKELINNAVEQGEQVGIDSSKYYLKGNSNITYSPSKKLALIVAGQSNIDGRNSYSDYPYLSNNPNPKVHFKNSVNGSFTSFEVTDGGQNNDWSFDAIVYNLLTETSHGNLSDIYVMKKSMGGTSIDPMGNTNYHWTADYEFLTSEKYSLLRSFESIVRAGVTSDGSNFDIKAMLWHQGEGDMQNEQVANRYYENLKNMLAYVRGVVGNPRLYFFCGNISLNRTSPGFVNVINAAYTKLASEDPYFKVVDMSNAQLEDGYHFNYQWSIYFGQKVYDLMIDAGIINGTKINPSEPT